MYWSEYYNRKYFFYVADILRNKLINTEWPKKCIHSLLINIFGINLNEISISA